MTRKRVAQWFTHYFLGLVAQSFNGAIATLSGLLALDSTGHLPEGITFQLVWQTFIVALGIQAILYFHAHPFPVLNVDSVVKTTTTDAVQTTVIKTNPV